jgi:hypothetical protein
MLTKSGQATGIPDDPEHSLALRQVNRERGFPAIKSNLDIIRQQLARQPAWRDLSRH